MFITALVIIGKVLLKAVTAVVLGFLIVTVIVALD